MNVLLLMVKSSAESDTYDNGYRQVHNVAA